MPTLFRQYIFMVTDRQHLTGLNHKISSLAWKLSSQASSPWYLSSALPPISRSLIGQRTANERLAPGHVTQGPAPLLPGISPTL